MLHHTCPGKIEVHANKGGPVLINGKKATVKTVNKNYYEAKGSGVPVSITTNSDGTTTVSYTGSGGKNGICSETENHPKS
jgi:hypothetical protein